MGEVAGPADGGADSFAQIDQDPETSALDDFAECGFRRSGIHADPDHHLIVCDLDGEIVSACACVVVPNLTRNARPYALIENVVTRADCRGRGHASACLARAQEIARAAGCYKIMLLTGAKDEKTLDFYHRTGFDDTEKTAFVLRLNP